MIDTLSCADAAVGDPRLVAVVNAAIDDVMRSHSLEGGGAVAAASRAVQIHEILQDRIMALDLTPATVPPRGPLMEQVGQTPVRDALLHLQEDGLTEIPPRPATIVWRIDIGYARQARFLRLSIEPEMVRRLSADCGRDPWPADGAATAHHRARATAWYAVCREPSSAAICVILGVGRSCPRTGCGPGDPRAAKPLCRNGPSPGSGQGPGWYPRRRPGWPRI